MTIRRRAAAVAAAILVAPLAAAAVATPAEAAQRYSNCTALARDFPHGVAKSAAAAQRQVRDGYGRPATTRRAKAVYRTNFRSLDRDRDGTACER